VVATVDPQLTGAIINVPGWFGVVAISADARIIGEAPGRLLDLICHSADGPGYRAEVEFFALA
jgi:hypothetical protein